MDIFNTVCRDLPSGYSLEIRLEKGCGSININDPKCADIEWHLDDTPFDEQIKAAVEWCIEDAKSRFRPPRYDAIFRTGTEELNGM